MQQSPDRLAWSEKVPRSPVCGRSSVASLQWYVSVCDEAQGGYWLLWDTEIWGWGVHCTKRAPTRQGPNSAVAQGRRGVRLVMPPGAARTAVAGPTGAHARLCILREASRAAAASRGCRADALSGGCTAPRVPRARARPVPARAYKKGASRAAAASRGCRADASSGGRTCGAAAPGPVSERPCPCARGAAVGRGASGSWVCFLSEATLLSDFVFQILRGTLLTCSQVSVMVVRHNDDIGD